MDWRLNTESQPPVWDMEALEEFVRRQRTRFRERKALRPCLFTKCSDQVREIRMNDSGCERPRSTGQRQSSAVTSPAI
jgi:hypothetical protein